jgi:hypothetical protein
VTGRYELGTAPPARRALAELLPHDVAVAAIEFITGPLLENPRRVGRPLGGSGIWCSLTDAFSLNRWEPRRCSLDIRHQLRFHRRR